MRNKHGPRAAALPHVTVTRVNCVSACARTAITVQVRRTISPGDSSRGVHKGPADSRSRRPAFSDAQAAASLWIEVKSRPSRRPKLIRHWHRRPLALAPPATATRAKPHATQLRLPVAPGPGSQSTVMGGANCAQGTSPSSPSASHDDGALCCPQAAGASVRVPALRLPGWPARDLDLYGERRQRQASPQVQKPATRSPLALVPLSDRGPTPAAADAADSSRSALREYSGRFVCKAVQPSLRWMRRLHSRRMRFLAGP